MLHRSVVKAPCLDHQGLPSINTKHLYNICSRLDKRQRRWADVVQMLYKCFVFAGQGLVELYYIGAQYADSSQNRINILQARNLTLGSLMADTFKMAAIRLIRRTHSKWPPSESLSNLGVRFLTCIISSHFNKNSILCEC